jgi:glycosyltransferase involved in cell wall biosynthesis
VPREAEKDHCEQLKSELGFSATHRLIGTIARLDTNKNHSMLIKAFHRLSAAWPNARLVIIGKGPTRDQLMEEVLTLGLVGRVLLTGALPDAARYIPAFDVCCLTSRTEGTPNLLMEASAAGVPVVATRSGGSSEVIADGSTGFLVPLEDDTIFASRVEMLLANPEYAKRMGLSGREKVLDEFSVSAMVSSMTRVYSEQIAAKQQWSAQVRLGAGD